MHVFSLYSCAVKGDVFLAEISKHCLPVCQKEREKKRGARRKTEKRKTGTTWGNNDRVTIQLESPVQWQLHCCAHESRLPFVLKNGDICCLDATEERTMMQVCSLPFPSGEDIPGS